MQSLPASLSCSRAAFAACGTLQTCAAHSAARLGLRSATYVLLGSSPFPAGRSLRLSRHFVSSSGNPNSNDSPSSNSSKNLAWLPDPSAAIASRSAEESFKAASWAELAALQAVGLDPFTAEAVRAVRQQQRQRLHVQVDYRHITIRLDPLHLDLYVLAHWSLGSCAGSANSQVSQFVWQCSVVCEGGKSNIPKSCHPVICMRLSELAQAWYSGQLKQWADAPNVFHKSRRSTQTLSPKRLLVRVQQIIRAHTAAATSAAAGSGPAAQQPPVRSRKHAAVQLPHETVHSYKDSADSTAGPSAAEGSTPAAGNADAAGGQLGWGDINIQRILAVDPSLLLVRAVVPQTGCLLAQCLHCRVAVIRPL
jgi:hypothetical protein